MNERRFTGATAVIAISGLVMIHFAAAVEIGQRPLAAYFRTEWLEEALTILLLPAIGWSGFVAWAVWRRGIDRPLSAIRRIAYLDRGRLGRRDQGATAREI